MFLGLPAPKTSFRPRKPATITAHVFLAETCPISQQATRVLRARHPRYAGKGVALTGVFPDARGTPASLAAFAQTYQLALSLRADSGQRRARRLGATITPKAVVLAADGRTVLYRGRLDNSYAGLGQRRAPGTTRWRAGPWPRGGGRLLC